MTRWGSDSSQCEGWWQASGGKWYPPESRSGAAMPGVESTAGGNQASPGEDFLDMPPPGSDVQPRDLPPPALTMEEVLDLWTKRWGPLDSDHRVDFLAQPEAALLTGLPVAQVRHAIAESNRLDQILEAAAEFQDGWQQKSDGTWRPVDPQRSASAGERLLKASAEIVPVGSRSARITGETLGLRVDGQDVGRITRKRVAADMRMRFVVGHLKSTRIEFFDGRIWGVFSVEPGPRSTGRTLFGNPKKVPHAPETRVVVVRDGFETLANTRGLLPNKKSLRRSKHRSAFVEANGHTYHLSPSWRARGGTIDDLAKLERSGMRQCRVTAAAPLPLSVVLLHWHLLVGDWKPPNEGGG